MLIAALNKHWRPLSYDQFWHEMDLTMTNNAIYVAGFSRELIDAIWVKKRAAFEVF
jgi:hypothetical protein